jgi:hypothetical protein
MQLAFIGRNGFVRTVGYDKQCGHETKTAGMSVFMPA